MPTALWIAWAVATTLPAPPTYRCLPSREAIAIDGVIDEPAWSAAAWTDDFCSLRGRDQPSPPLRTRAKLLRGDHFLYIAAEMSDPDVRATMREHDAALYTETALEVFIDPDADGRRYVEIQVNPHNATLDLLLSKPYGEGGKADRTFTVEGLRSAVHVNGTLNDASDRDEGWTVELAIPIAAIEQLAEKKTSRWRMELARSCRERDAAHPSYSAWSPTGLASLHVPSQWGWLEFSE